MKCLPKLPVPPVTRTDFSFRSIQGWVKSRRGAAAAADLETSGAMASAAGLMQFPLLGKHGREPLKELCLTAVSHTVSIRKQDANAGRGPGSRAPPRSRTPDLESRPTPRTEATCCGGRA